MPPAFNLSQDQTLQFKNTVAYGDKSFWEWWPKPTDKKIGFEKVTHARFFVQRTQVPTQVSWYIVKKRLRHLLEADQQVYAPALGQSIWKAAPSAWQKCTNWIVSPGQDEGVHYSDYCHLINSYLWLNCQAMQISSFLFKNSTFRSIFRSHKCRFYRRYLACQSVC